jgi:hypothetical protein
MNGEQVRDVEEAVVPLLLRYRPGMCLEEFGKVTKILSQKSR